MKPKEESPALAGGPAKKPLEPIVVEITQAPEPPEPDVPFGMVRMIGIDANGEEIGQQFDIPERGLTYGCYSDKSKFKLKKKANK